MNGSDSDSPCQYFSHSDVDGGMEAEERTRADTRCGLLRVGRGRRFGDYDRCEGSQTRGKREDCVCDQSYHEKRGLVAYEKATTAGGVLIDYGIVQQRW